MAEGVEALSLELGTLEETESLGAALAVEAQRGDVIFLRGELGAGKTTLLDCLADRRTGVGVLTGEMLVDGKIRDESFQRKTGYAQQQDLHLETSTVREVRLSQPVSILL